jgi:hypothetical protein
VNSRAGISLVMLTVALTVSGYSQPLKSSTLLFSVIIIMTRL